jgi:TetR/AcrR family transcriptional regulator, regulator of cefoperazone and chloramphenicol sensitivity
MFMGGLRMGTPRDSIKTRSKIIEAAGQLFKDRGFKGVTVREIAKNADVHLGALNYHFRSKDALYKEVLLAACEKSSISEDEQNKLLAIEPREALYLIIKESLKILEENESSNWESILLTRECWEPSSVFEEIVDSYFKPQSKFVADIVSKIAGLPSDSPMVKFAEISMLGLIETCGSYRKYVDAVSPGLMEFGMKDDWFAKQITHLVVEAAKQKG